MFELVSVVSIVGREKLVRLYDWAEKVLPKAKISPVNSWGEQVIQLSPVSLMKIKGKWRLVICH